MPLVTVNWSPDEEEARVKPRELKCLHNLKFFWKARVTTANSMHH